MSTPTFAEIMADKNNGPLVESHWVCVSKTLHKTSFKLGSELRELQTLLEDARDELDRMNRATDSRQGGSPRRLVGATTRQQLTQNIGELDERIASKGAEIDQLRVDNPTAFYEVFVQALPEAEWLSLRAKHPVTEKTVRVIDPQGPDGRTGGIDLDSFAKPGALQCLTDPEPTEENIAFLEQVLSAGEWRTLGILAFNVNESGRTVPKSPLPTSLTTDSGHD